MDDQGIPQPSLPARHAQARQSEPQAAPSQVRGRHQMSRCCVCDCFFLDTRVNQAMVERRRIRDGIEAIRPSETE
jgi:hypothetical protein